MADHSCVRHSDKEESMTFKLCCRWQPSKGPQTVKEDTSPSLNQFEISKLQ